MNILTKAWFAAFFLGFAMLASGQISQKVVDLPTRPGVTQRFLLLEPPEPKAVVILMAGGHGGLQIYPGGAIKWGESIFLIRNRQMFADKGFAVAVVDAPSDRQSSPYLNGFRQTPEHAADIKAVIARLREQFKVPVWLAGTSRGTQSVAYVGIALSGPDGPDGLVLTSSILVDPKSRAVSAMGLSQLRIPVLVVHHEQDGCSLCPFSETSTLMGKLTNAPRKQLLTFAGGLSQGDPCEGMAHHGFNGIEADVVAQTVAWMLDK